MVDLVKTNTNITPPLIDPETVDVKYSIVMPTRNFIDTIGSIDFEISRGIQGFSSTPLLSIVMKLLSHSADGLLYFAFGALAIYADIETGTRFCLIALTAFAIELPIQKVLKRAFKRARPFTLNKGIMDLVAPPDLYSFPSGHTAGATIMAILIPLVFGIDIVGVTTILLLSLWALGVGLSRIYNGVHYTSDVIAGAGLGTVSALLALLIYSF